MTRREIELLNNEVVTMEQMEEIEMHEEVTAVENCGTSGQVVNGTLYEVQFEDGETIDIILK